MWKISVIIPVYNVGKLLNRCMDSVCHQTYGNLEVLLIDDGSTDGSGQFCDRYAKQDKRVRVIHQPNQGLGFARNTGLSNATGEYISFVDSDDYLDTTAYEKLLCHLQEQPCDICYFGHFRVRNGQAVPYDVPPAKTCYTGKEESLGQLFSGALLGKPQSGAGFTGLSVCTALYSRKLIDKHHLRFLSEREILSEDALFNLDACALAHTVLVYPEHLYYYVIRTGSLTRHYHADRFRAALCMDKALMEAAGLYDAQTLLYRGIENSICMNLIVCIKQELLFEREIGHKEVLAHLREMGSSDRVRQCLSGNAFQVGLGRRLIAQSMKWRKWKWVYWITKAGLLLEQIRFSFRRGNGASG